MPDEGAVVCFDNHWRLMVKEGRAVRNGALGSEAKNIQVVLADRADEKVKRLKAQAKSLVVELEAAEREAKQLRTLANEKDTDTKRRIERESKERAAKVKSAQAEAEKQAAAKVKAASKSKR